MKTLFEVLQNNSYIPAPPTPSTPVPEPPKPSNPPTSPKPMGKRLLSTDETLRPQAAEVSCFRSILHLCLAHIHAVCYTNIYDFIDFQT